MKAKEIDRILKQEQVEEAPIIIRQRNKHQVVHTMRALFIVVDMTKSMQMKDFKPSRLSVVSQMIKNLIKKSKDQTPLIKFSLAIVEQENCKIKSKFTYDQHTLFAIIDQFKVQPQPGYYSLEKVITVTLDVFDGIPNQFKKELLLIQSSPSTKDEKDINIAIRQFKKSAIQLNIVSLVGCTRIYSKLAEQCDGEYLSVSTSQQFKCLIERMSSPPLLNSEDTKHSLIKMTLCKKQYDEGGKFCFCHLKKCKNYYVCNVCEAILCKEPPYECEVCSTLIVLPTDLSRHKLTT